MMNMLFALASRKTVYLRTVKIACLALDFVTINPVLIFLYTKLGSLASGSVKDSSFVSLMSKKIL